MINFISFLTTLVLALCKLFGSMALCIVSFLAFMFLTFSLFIIFFKDKSWVWDEIKAMENDEYGGK